MMRQSAHRDVAFFRFEGPSTGYRGFHLRPYSDAARSKLVNALEALSSGQPALFKFANKPIADPEFDNQRWPRSDFERVQLAVGQTKEPEVAADLAIWLAPEAHSAIIETLRTISVYGETMYKVTLANGDTDWLTLWWIHTP